MSEKIVELTERSIIIVGVGLIGGSIAAALRRRHPDLSIIGVGRNSERLRKAQEAGFLTGFTTTISQDTIPSESLGVVCLPVDQIPSAVIELLGAGCSLVTDAGSVKSRICESLLNKASKGFIGSHPIAGSEHSGYEHSDADLFVNRLCVVTPLQNGTEQIDRVIRFWQAVGCNVQTMSPAEHDRILALTSHLPHIMASVSASCVPSELLAFAGTGYRDTTRIAAGSASLWASILIENAAHCITAIKSAEAQLAAFRKALESDDSVAVEKLWRAASELRRQLQ
ncbi:MAG: prephenate dehydrogenase [Planctomycetota bacterium]